VKKAVLIPHHKNALQLLDKLKAVKLEHVCRSANKIANTLANLAATLALGGRSRHYCAGLRSMGRSSSEDGDEEEVKTVSVYEVDRVAKHRPLIDYLKHRKLSNASRHKTEVQWRASHFLYYKRILYRHSFLGLWLRCLDDEEGENK